MKTYQTNEVFYSLQGEGIRAGEPSIFVRFSGCNLKCDVEPGPLSIGGFACDTEFVSGRALSAEELLAWVREEGKNCRWIVLTGGEPGLQLDSELIAFLHQAGYKLAIETNGSLALPDGLDWVTVSPKVAEHAIKQLTATEVKYVRAWGQGIPKTVVKADYYLISPAFSGNQVDRKTLDWCIELCKEHPQWRLSVQQHKMWAVR